MCVSAYAKAAPDGLLRAVHIAALLNNDAVDTERRVDRQPHATLREDHLPQVVTQHGQALGVDSVLHVAPNLTELLHKILLLDEVQAVAAAAVNVPPVHMMRRSHTHHPNAGVIFFGTSELGLAWQNQILD